MKTLCALIFSFLIFVSTTWAMGSHGGGGGGHGTPQPPPSGPWLFCVSEGADLFELDIDGVLFDYDASDDFKMNVDLRWHLNQPGDYDVSVVPRNKDGSGKEIFFSVQIVKMKNGLLWKMIPLDYLIAEDPEYMNSFSVPDLEMTTGR
jgi:hypothetical protein